MVAVRPTKNQLRRAKVEEHRQAAIGLRLPAVRTQLTRREQAIIQQQVAPLFARGEVNLAYMGVRFLELWALGWTPKNGIECSEDEFRQIWVWWTALNFSEKAEIITITHKFGEPMPWFGHGN